jgi:Tfp pilus assembly protein PilF
MRRRRLIAFSIALLITFGVSAMWTASTIERDGDSDVNLMADGGSEAGSDADTTVEKKKGGNKVVRVLAAPFKAFGRLFGGGDDKKVRRMTEKDAEKFESVGVARVNDSREREAAVSATGSAQEHLAIGREALQEGRLNQAIAELSTAVSLNPKLGEAHNLLGVAYAQKGMQDRAKESYERAVKVEPDDAQTLNNLGFSLYQNGNYRAAVDKLKRAVKLAPTDDRILNNLGLALCRLGKFDEAYKQFARANGPLTGSLNTAKMLERFGREDDAIKYYENARIFDPYNTIALRRLADLYNRVGRLEDSQVAANTLAKATAQASVSSGK